MKKVKIVIERTSDGYVGYSTGDDLIHGMGDTVSECKEDIMNNIESHKLLPRTDQPKWLTSDYELVFNMDTRSILEYFKGILSKSALERLTGINQKQIHHYSSGIKKPRPAQIKKIEAALHKLGKELISIEL